MLKVKGPYSVYRHILMIAGQFHIFLLIRPCSINDLSTALTAGHCYAFHFEQGFFHFYASLKSAEAAVTLNGAVARNDKRKGIGCESVSYRTRSA